MPKTLATAAVDRLLHHAHVVITEGGSLRLAEAMAARGGAPGLRLTGRADVRLPGDPDVR